MRRKVWDAKNGAQSVGAQSVGRKVWVRKVWGAKYGAQSMGAQSIEAQSMRCKVWSAKNGSKKWGKTDFHCIRMYFRSQIFELLLCLLKCMVILTIPTLYL